MSEFTDEECIEILEDLVLWYTMQGYIETVLAINSRLQRVFKQ